MPSSDGSVFQAVKSRELQCSKVHGRPSVRNMTSEESCSGSGVLTVEQNGISAPPLAISFGKTALGTHLLAVADEEGFVSIFNTCHSLPSSINSPHKTGDVRTELWLAHSNAIFDVCWIRDDAHMLTASGDQTVRLWDVEARAGLGVMKGHSGSVKSLSGHPYLPDIFASGSRDGTVALWDLRSNSTRNCADEQCFVPVSVIKDAHLAKQPRKLRRCKANTKSVTAVLCLKDDRIVATAGAADGIVKFWDTRKLNRPVAQSPPQSHLSVEGKKGRVHGIAGLSQDPTGASLIASCTDNRVYLYSVLRPEEGSLTNFSGHIMGSFYIKAAFSPDGTHILSGSSDGNVFIWQMNNPQAPVVLKGHGGEVTAVDWCPTDFCKIATCSDDFTVRVWSNLKPQFESSCCSSSTIRRRISAEKCSTLAGEAAYPLTAHGHESTSSGSPSYRVNSKESSPDLNESRASETIKDLSKASQRVESFNEEQAVASEAGSPEPPRSAGATTHFVISEAQNCSKQNRKTLDGTFSPSSVLNPPCSLKRRRTMIDYYGNL